MENFSLVFQCMSAVSVLVFFTFMKLRPLRMRSRSARRAPPLSTVPEEMAE